MKKSTFYKSITIKTAEDGGLIYKYSKTEKNGDAAFVHRCRDVAIWRVVFEK